MTTTVIIKAHCASTKEVRVIIHDGPNTGEGFTLQDGETAERHVYDAREISVCEVLKPVQQTP